MTTIIPPLSLDEKEDEAHRYYLNALENWRKFLQIALDIKASNAWQQKANTWEQYCRDFLPVGASRIRQYKGAGEVAHLIENVTGVTPNEHQVRQLKSVVSEDDKHMLPQIYKKAHELSDGKPARRHFKAAYEVEVELSTTGMVSVGEQARLPDELARDAAHKEAAVEADKRFDEHKKGHKPSEKFVGTIKLVRDKHGVCYPAVILPQEMALQLVDTEVSVYVPIVQHEETEDAQESRLIA